MTISLITTNVLRFATQINNNGWVIGHGWLNGDTGTTPDHRTSYGFLAKPIKIDIRADFDDNGIVDGGDFATFADQWLLEDDRYVPITILEEGFERMPVDLPYPWDANDPNGSFESPYVGAVYTVDFPEHDREFLEDKVLCLQNTNTQYTISCKSHSYRVEYDFLVNDPDGGCSNLNTTMDPTYSEGRSSSFHLFAEMGCDQFIRDRDGIFWYGDSTEFKITELIPNTWYHVDRTIDVLNRTEEINILNIDTEEEYNYSSPPLYSYDGVGSLGFFTYSDPSNYVLLDNLRIEATQTQE